MLTASHNAVFPAAQVSSDAIDLEQFLAGPGPEAAAVLADLDGCLISGSTVLPGAAELVRRTGERLWIVSNNSSDTAQTLSVRLSHMGLQVPAERIFLAGEQAVRELAAAMPRCAGRAFCRAPASGARVRPWPAGVPEKLGGGYCAACSRPRYGQAMEKSVDRLPSRPMSATCRRSDSPNLD
ncbi:hypothetical protein GCM10011385_41100 [Nitratireductor aestuarii]|uniref:Haloacid dehalogenase-like hydrolase n=1 Tax=Nitratireductor aestuarii TaxID=1735103 RepID=A0A916S5Z2_9HYPH|nr:hypothetical protein [Nitratireductor aestuarii]GGA82653.1 hypothetical protein GCM10011385_41100 [Nitratireductor aestuarii]